MDLTTILGIIIGVGGILIGNTLEGGHFSSLLQGAAALIVFGGTFGATVVGNTAQDLRLAFVLFKESLKAGHEDLKAKVAEEIKEAANIARRDSLLALEGRLKNFSSPFMKNVFRLMIDGIEPETIRNLFESEIEVTQQRRLAGAKVWSDAGGFAPTIGIIGAVLGLISVMANLTDTSLLGQGIAVAFVATIYGVGSANLFFIPIANKIRRRIQQESELKQMILEGGLAIASGMNPYIVSEKIAAFMGDRDSSGLKL